LSDTDEISEAIQMLRAVSTDTLAGLLIKEAGMRSRAAHGVRPLNAECCRFVGPAFTVRFVPLREDFGDRASMVNSNSALYGTIDTIPAGGVVMMDMRGDTSCGGLGDVLVAALIARGVAGLVADGAMRDGDAIRRMKLPVFCAGIAPAPVGRALFTAGIQETIGCGGVMVIPGDIVVGDYDGVVVVPRHLALELGRKGAERDRVEAWVRARIERGEPATGLYPPSEATVAEYRRLVASGELD